ncbi:MAG: Rhodanese-like domain-containing protein [Monoraphidium minutum]|nr:MAG: Rhodanese-like domain-containing protein [Monoraphidium minutum]
MSDSAPVLSAQETADLLAKGGVTYLDVRTPEEFTEGHVPGSVNIPLMLQPKGGGAGHDGLEPNAAFVDDAKKRFPEGASKLVLACAAGRRAARAADLLSAAGFTDLSVFKPGWSQWKEDGRPVEK